MKKVIFIPVILALLSFAVNQPLNQDHPEGFHFFHVIHLDDEAILTKDNLLIQPLMLSKDHDYDFVLKNLSSNVLLTIKDDRDVIIATNYDLKTKTYFNSLVFQSHISEFYHVEIKAEEFQKGGVCKIYSKCHLTSKDKCKK